MSETHGHLSRVSRRSGEGSAASACPSLLTLPFHLTRPAFKLHLFIHQTPIPPEIIDILEGRTHTSGI